MSPTIMVVEDESATRRLYRFLLQNSGYNVVEAEDGVDALEKLMVHKCDLIITDMNMPRMDGLDLVRTLRQNQSQVYVIMVTAFGTPDTEKKAFRAGVNEYLTKPFDFDELERRLQKYFARQNQGDD
ncbi:response regulator [Chloroflexus sp.]|uniref:response regulator n=1 Tax=Chloroflexus sp. TaxID=1904827 RepID=UPI002612BB60|nr:response regulator [uncultured Chloroflexus sp.]